MLSLGYFYYYMSCDFIFRYLITYFTYYIFYTMYIFIQYVLRIDVRKTNLYLHFSAALHQYIINQRCIIYQF